MGEFETLKQTGDKIEGLHNCEAPTHETRPDHNTLRTMWATLLDELHLIGPLTEKCILWKAQDNTKPILTKADCLRE